MAALTVIGIVISGVALIVAATSAGFARLQLRLAERQRQRDFEAAVAAELTGISLTTDALRYEVSVTNAGPAVARDVDVSLVAWTDASALGVAKARADVAPALLRGERRRVVLELPLVDAQFDDRSVSTELHADYYDDNGVRNERLALVFKDSLVLTPQPHRQTNAR